MQLDIPDLKYANASVRNYIKQIENRNLELQANIEKIQKEYENKIKDFELNYLILKEQYELLIYKRFARSAEQLIADKSQPLLFNEESKKPEAAKEEEAIEVKPYKRSKGGRKPIDSKLERREKIIDIPESEKTCGCGAVLTRIGEETSENVHVEPPRIWVERTIRPKYACRKCEGTEDEGLKPTIRIMPVEPSIIPRSIVSPSLLGTIITQKFVLHLPYYRQEKQFEWIGISISRQDMSNWQQKGYNTLSPLFILMKEAVKSGPIIQMDETPMQVMGDVKKKEMHKSYMWVARGGPPGRPVLWYEHHETRGGEHAKKFLQGYSGYLQTDGYNGYDSAVKDMPGIIHAGCYAHARRYFFEAAKISSQGKLAEEGIEHIRKLYEIEKKLRQRYNKEEEQKIFTRVRQLCAWRPLKEFKEWLLKYSDQVPPSQLLGEAIWYSLRQWDKMVKYLESPYLTPDTNAVENAIRNFVVGRKSWLFCQSADGADSSCGMYTLIETAKQNGLNPFQYLKTLFEKAPYAKTVEDWKKLLPWNIFAS